MELESSSLMSQLPHLLVDFRAGRLSQAELFVRAESLLNDDGDNIHAILEELQQEHAKAPLPLATFVALRKHLNAASAPKTVALTPPQTEILPSVPASASGASPAPPSTSKPPKEEDVAAQAIGATLAGRFKLIEYIGSGGTSRLYKAVDQRKVEAGAEDPHVAVKILTLPITDTLEALAVLHRETEGLQALAHPNIVRVIDCDRDGDLVFMTMEFIRGKTLHALMRNARFAGSGRVEAWPVIHGVANALEFAHSRFIVHGDLTPGNVMVSPTGEVKVIDFGIARLFGQRADASKASGRTNSRGEIGGYSPSYASPETIEQRDPDPRDDIYSLACIVWELLTGSRPFGKRDAKKARDDGAVLHRDENLSKHEFAALSRALKFSRVQRTPTVREFIEELTASSRRRTTPIAVAAGIAFALIASGFVYFMRDSQAPVDAGTRIAEPQLSPAPTADAPPIAGAVFRDCPTCPLMTVLPRGEFVQGSPPNGIDAIAFEQPQRRVSIGTSLATSRTEITVDEFAEFVQATDRDMRGCASYDGEWTIRDDVHWKNAVDRQTPSHPVSCVSWQDAADYAQWLSERTGQTYRLPSASEWEYAARAGSTADRAWTSETDACVVGNLADQAAAQRYPGWTVHNCNDAYAQAAPTASYAANAFGLHDMLGNVFEWVSDCWIDTYEGAPVDGSARRDGDCARRELRGGSWFTAPSYVRFAYRNHFAGDYRSTSIGFRIVREISP